MDFRIRIDSDVPLDEGALGDDPLGAVEGWLAEAGKSEERFPGAMALATVTEAGDADVRMVQLHRVTRRGFEFHTNLESTKVRQMASHPNVALAFYWASLHRQIRVSGRCEPLSEVESDAYWQGRERASQIASVASFQSRPLASRKLLEDAFRHLDDAAPGTLPRPSFWGGYRVIPLRIEFWQGRRNRLHDRIRFERERDGGTWTRVRLYP